MKDKRPRMPRPAPLAELLAAALRGKPAEKRLREGKIWEIWGATVGPQIASRARPAAFRDGTLTVAVASAPWMQQLSFMKREIIAKLNEGLGEPLVQEMFLKTGKIPAAEKVTPRRRPPQRPLAPAEVEWVAGQTAAIDDPELRTACESLLARHLVGQKPRE